MIDDGSYILGILYIFYPGICLRMFYNETVIFHIKSIRSRSLLHRVYNQTLIKVEHSFAADLDLFQ